MVKKMHQPNPDSQAQDHAVTGAQLAQSVKDSAQQIWLAGLGAFSKAQAEGGKVFETLVKDGVGLQRKTQAAAEEKIAEVTSKMANMASDITAKATDITSKATGRWDKLETIFEDRVAKAMHKMGMPTAKEVQALAKRVDELSAQLKKAPVKSAAKPAAAPKAAAKKAAVKRAPAR